MALIKCNECGKEISDKASACPNCACPIETKQENIKDYKELTREEQSALISYMKDRGVLHSTTETVFCIIALILWFFGVLVWWVLFLPVPFLFWGAISSQNETKRKYYYEHPNCINKKIKK